MTDSRFDSGLPARYFGTVLITLGIVFLCAGLAWLVAYAWARMPVGNAAHRLWEEAMFWGPVVLLLAGPGTYAVVQGWRMRRQARIHALAAVECIVLLAAATAVIVWGLPQW